MKKLTLLLFLLILIPTLSWAAPTCSGSGASYQCTSENATKTKVQDAVTLVIANGQGTVNIPAGDATWSGNPISIRGTLPTFNIIGAGVGQTILRLTNSSDSYFWFDDPNYDWTTVGDVRVSGISFIPHVNETPWAGFQSNGLVTFWRVKSFRFDHNYVESTSKTSQNNSFFLVKNTGKGLVDNNWFVQNNYNGYDSYLWEIGSCHTPNEYAAENPQPSEGGIYADCYHEGSHTTGCTCMVGEDPAYRSSSVGSTTTDTTVIARLAEKSSGSGSSAAAIINNTGGSGTGHMQRIYFYINSVGSSPTVDIASFYVVSGNTLSTRASATGISVHVGLNYLTAGTDFTAFDINNGDYLGINLHNCTLSKGPKVLEGGGAVASSHWSVANDQIPASSVPFTLGDGGISLWGEIYDTENVLSVCEAAWKTWYDADPNLERTAGATPARVWSSTWKPAVDDNTGIFFEDNYFQWRQAAIEGNWMSIQKVTIRHNTFQLPTPPYTGDGVTEAQSQPTMKSAGLFLHMHDNVFNYFSHTRNDFSFSGQTITMSGTGTWPHPDPNGYIDLRHAFAVGNTIIITGSVSNNRTVTVASISKTQIVINESSFTTESAGNVVTLARSGFTLDSGQGLAHLFMMNGLIYNNVINNHWYLWTIGDGMRTYGNGTMIIPEARPRHLHIWNNSGYNNTCGVTVDSLDCTDTLQWGIGINGLVAYGGSPGVADGVGLTPTGTLFFRAPASGETLYGYADYQYPYLGGGPATYNDSLGLSIKGFFDKHLRGAGMGVLVN